MHATSLETVEPSPELTSYVYGAHDGAPIMPNYAPKMALIPQLRLPNPKSLVPHSFPSCSVLPTPSCTVHAACQPRDQE